MGAGRRHLGVGGARWVGVRVWCVSLLLGVARGAAPSPPGGSPQSDASGGEIVARVGAEAITAADLLAAARRVGPRRLAAYGAGWPEQRRALLQQVVTVDALLRRAAGSGGGGSLTRRALRDEALRAALRRKLRREAAAASASEAEVKAFYEEHRRHFERPRCIHLARILMASPSRAANLVAQLRQGSLADFRRAARDHSLDEATNMRGGDLGCVMPNGHTHRPQVRVAPALFEAADPAADGALVPRVVPEGKYSSVVWRVGSRPAQIMPAAQARQVVVSRLVEVRYFAALRELTRSLRGRWLSGYAPERVASLPAAWLRSLEPLAPAPAADVPPAAPPRPHDPEPRATERGLR